ncbi:MAG: LysR substrate-binding domain-containing protein [Burkholderiaceae bacterium]
MNINLKLISAFLSVANHASFRKAAEETHRSLPAISMQIKQLEEQLGVVLFQRTTRKVELTAEGEQLMLSARKALVELEIGLSKLQQSVDLQSGRLSLACVPTVAGARLPLILTTFAAKFPRIKVHVRELAGQDLFAAVRRHEVDFAIGPVQDDAAELEFEPLFSDPYCALLPRGMQDTGKGVMSLQQLSRGMPLLKLGASTTFRDHVDRVLKNDGVDVEASYEFLQASTMVAMAEAGLGVALLPLIAVPPSTDLKVVRIKPALSRTISIVKVRRHRLSPSASRFVALCRDILA